MQVRIEFIDGKPMLFIGGCKEDVPYLSQLQNAYLGVTKNEITIKYLVGEDADFKFALEGFEIK